jgi:hypothetical protein
MKTMKRTAKTIGKVLLALVGAALMPILIWVALGAAINERARERKATKTSVRTVGQVLASARR